METRTAVVSFAATSLVATTLPGRKRCSRNATNEPTTKDKTVHVLSLRTLSEPLVHAAGAQTELFLPRGKLSRQVSRQNQVLMEPASNVYLSCSDPQSVCQGRKPPLAEAPPWRPEWSPASGLPPCRPQEGDRMPNPPSLQSGVPSLSLLAHTGLHHPTRGTPSAPETEHPIRPGTEVQRSWGESPHCLANMLISACGAQPAESP